MIITEKSKVYPISFSQSFLTEDEISSLYIPKRYTNLIANITRLNGTFYHFKFPSERFMINELIGSYLAKRINLDTVDYEIGLLKESYVALSKIFYEEGYQYFSSKSFLANKERSSYISGVSKFTGLKIGNLKSVRGESIFDDILKLTAVDLKMGQCDRHDGNLQVRIDKVGTISLAPIYDYGCSYMEDRNSVHYRDYVNPFVLVRRNPFHLGRLVRRFPKLWDYIQFLHSISMEEILGDIESQKLINFEDDEIEYYWNKQLEIDGLLDKIKIKRFFRKGN